jgi:hypothetical protein
VRNRLPFRAWWSIYVEHRLESFHYHSWWGAPVRWFGRAIYRIRRYIEGARSVPCNGYEDTRGYICEDGLEIEFAGACPVQGEGTLDGHDVYYRSRGEGWQFHVAGPSGDVFGDDAWEYAEVPYIFPDGGWVDRSVSEACIRRAVAKWREENP